MHRIFSNNTFSPLNLNNTSIKTLTATTYFENVENYILKSFPVRFTVNADLANQNPVDLLHMHFDINQLRDDKQKHSGERLKTLWHNKSRVLCTVTHVYSIQAKKTCLLMPENLVYTLYVYV